MHISRQKKNAITISGLDPFLTEMLAAIPENADPGSSEAARERLFSAPANDDPKLADEWKEFVEPDLKHLFQSAVETVAQDLKNVQPDEIPGCSLLRIPLDHLDAWLNALNQARLALSARENFGEKEIAGEIPESINSQHDLALFHVHFYGILQECFLQQTEE